MNDRLDARLMAEYVAIMRETRCATDDEVDRIAEVVTCGDILCDEHVNRRRNRQLISKDGPAQAAPANARLVRLAPIIRLIEKAWPRGRQQCGCRSAL